MRRLVRDLARQTDKLVDLVLEGGETEIDKALVDRLYDPLMKNRAWLGRRPATAPDLPNMYYGNPKR